MIIQPCPEYRTLGRIPSLGEQYADFQLLDGNNGQIQVAGNGIVCPVGKLLVSLTEANLSEL